MTKTLGIAFGGSGAEGIACIAYVRALEELGVTPSIVSGAGIGGVIAAMYAAGMTSDNMISFLEEIDFPGTRRPININKVKDFKYGILDGMGLEEYFQMVMPVKVFDRLYFPLRLVAAEYATGDEVVFDSGDVGTAVRACVSIPGLFSPYEKDDESYLDGSCVNPVPFDIIRADCEILVSVDPEVNAEEDEDGLSPFVFPALLGAFNAAKKALVEEKKRNCEVDVYERILLNGISTYDFAQYPLIIESVYDQVEEFKEKIREFLK